MASGTFNLFAGWGEKSENTRDILEKRGVLASEVPVVAKEEKKEQPPTTHPEKESEKKDLWSSLFNVVSGSESNQGSKSSVDSLIDSARSFASAEGETAATKPDLTLDQLSKLLEPIQKQLETAFSSLPVNDLDPVSFMFFLETEDSKKNPSWKRRQHRFCSGFDLETVSSLHESLYLAELAYVDSVEEIQDGIANFKSADDQYELIYCTVVGEPSKPAHFLAIKKDAEDVSKRSRGGFWSEDSYLDILLVVRGTKELTDVLSDALLEAAPYRDGCAHDGIAKSGKWLVESHLPLLEHVLEQSGHTKVRLSLVGHSLGAGAAAIACIEFNDHPKIEATCIAFEPPALVNKEMSESLKDKVTTIVADADCVPRLSGATIANLIIRVLEHDWKHRAVEDVESLLDFLLKKFPVLMTTDRKAKIMEFVENDIDKHVNIVKDLERRPIELFPPGKCIHFYRDGTGTSCVEVGCDFFDEIDVNLTMVEDHYIHSGCHAMFTDLMRHHLNDSKFFFPNDLMALRKEKNKKTGDVSSSS